MNEGSIKALIQGMSPSSVSIMQGTVIQVGPLKIQMDNDEKHIITERITIVPWHLTDYNTKVRVDWNTEYRAGGGGYAEYASHNHGIVGVKPITVLNALKLGDKLHILSLNNGKLYYVLDRVCDAPEG